jgi:hypothetical protein
MENTETNAQPEQVDVPSMENTDNSTNAEQPVSQDQEAYDKAFDEIDIDNPEAFFDSRVENSDEGNGQDQVPENAEQVQEEATNVNPFDVDESGYLKRPLIDRGKEVRVTPDELFQYGNKGVNYESKNEKLNQYKPQIKAIEQHDIQLEDIATLAALKDGNKEALKHLIDKYDVDVYELEQTDKEFKPKTEEYDVSPIEEVWNEYQEINPSGATVVASVFNELDDGFKEELRQENIFPLFIEDVEKGIFQELETETKKIKSLTPGVTWLQAYQEANRRMIEGVRPKRNRIPTDVGAPMDHNPNPNSQLHTVKADEIWNDESAFAEFEKQLII